MGLYAEWRDYWLGVQDFCEWIYNQVLEWAIGEDAWLVANEGKCMAGSDGSHPAVAKDGKPMTSSRIRMCERHYDKLAKILHSIETEAGDLDIRPSMAISLDHGGGNLASQQAPVRLDPLVLRDRRHGKGWSEGEEERHASGNTQSVMYVLLEYADRIRVDRGLTWPTTPQTVRTERQLLSRQLDWIIEQPWCAAFYYQMNQLLGQLQRANGTSQPRPIPGRCPVLVGVEGKQAECGGPLWPAKPQHVSESEKWTGSAPSAIKCSKCGARWEGGGPLARLALILDQQKRTRSA